MTSARYLGHPGFFSNPSDVSINYTDYLQTRQFVDSVRWEIQDSTKTLLAGTKENTNSAIRQIEKSSNDNVNALGEVASATYELSLSMDELRKETERGFARVGSVLDWGFSALIAATTRLGDKLEELIQVAKTPSQTWALEQFEMARDSTRKGLYPEAIEFLKNAIGGFASHTGNITEWRFHFLLGVVRLGHLNNISKRDINLIESVESFIASARYASSDAPIEAARSFMFAARAANLQGNYDRASELALKGLTLSPLAGLYYESAVAYLMAGHPGAAKLSLLEGMRKDRNLILKATGDNTFQSTVFLDEVLSDHLAESRLIAQRCRDWLTLEWPKVLDHSYPSRSGTELYSFSSLMIEQCSIIQNWLTALEKNLLIGGLLDVRDSLESFGTVIELIQVVETLFIERVISIFETESVREKADEARQIADAQNERMFLVDFYEKYDEILAVGLTVIAFVFVYHMAGDMAESMLLFEIGSAVIFYKVATSVISSNMKSARKELASRRIPNVNAAKERALMNERQRGDYRRTLDRHTGWAPVAPSKTTYPNWCRKLL